MAKSSPELSLWLRLSNCQVASARPTESLALKASGRRAMVATRPAFGTLNNGAVVSVTFEGLGNVRIVLRGDGIALGDGTDCGEVSHRCCPSLEDALKTAVQVRCYVSFPSCYNPGTFWRNSRISASLPSSSPSCPPLFRYSCSLCTGWATHCWNLVGKPCGFSWSQTETWASSFRIDLLLSPSSTYLTFFSSLLFSSLLFSSLLLHCLYSLSRGASAVSGSSSSSKLVLRSPGDGVEVGSASFETRVAFLGGESLADAVASSSSSSSSFPAKDKRNRAESRRVRHLLHFVSFLS